MNQNASPGLTVRAEAGLSALALGWLAGEMLMARVLTGAAAAVLIVVPVRLARAGDRHDLAHGRRRRTWPRAA